ncbi:hypothetical protein GYB22_05645 [bacterium]|nr:hypothetical protein [bacterium]
MVFLICHISACSNNSKHAESLNEDISVQNPFSKLLHSSYKIEDSAAFIKALREIYDLKVHLSPKQADEEKITHFELVNLMGSDEPYYLIEYDWIAGSTAEFPWKHQVLLDSEGRLIKVFNALRWELLNVSPHKNPVFLTVVASGKGNGGHEVYGFIEDSLENIYEGYFNYKVQTYDAHQDQSVFLNKELYLMIEDVNRDGYEDLKFYGTRIWLAKETPQGEYYDGEDGVSFTIENPAKIDSVEYVFLYDTVSGHFKEIE